jgi:hypothetical protein
MAISEQSLTQYHERATSLHKRWMKECGVQDDLATFSRWLLTLKPGVSAATWRHYRVAALYWLENQRDSAIAMAILDDDCRAGEVVPRKKASRKSSGQREKRIPPDHLERLVLCLRKVIATPNAAFCADLLECGVIVGLRPEEWRCTAVFGKSLFTKSVKTDNGKGLGGWRTIDVSCFQPEQLDKIQDLGDTCTDMDFYGTLDTRIRAAGRVLTAACRRIWPGRRGHRYQLYDCRHQCLANAKASVSRVAVAGLAGHSVTRTASKAYAAAGSAWPPSRRPPTPMPPQGVMNLILENHSTWPPEMKAGVRLPIPQRPSNANPRPE